MILQLGFRNLWRNKRRTLLAGLAVGLGLASIILADGFWIGMINNMVGNVTSTYMGHAQIHHPKFQDTFETEFYIEPNQERRNKLDQMQGVVGHTTRTLSFGMISSSRDSMNIRAVGIDPKTEVKLSKFHKRMVEGTYIDSENALNIGVALKDKLGVELGDRLVLTVTEVKTGEIKQELFRLSGVFGIGSKEMDEGIALIHSQKLKQLLKISGDHELAISFSDEVPLSLQMEKLKEIYNPKEFKVESWKELVPQVVAMIEMSDYSIGIMGGILFTLVALGILNTMFMSLFERAYEFGVLRAVGTKSSQIIAMVLAEAFALSVVAIVLGAIVAVFFGTIMVTYGIDYSGIQFGEVTFTEKMYYVFTIKQYTIYPLALAIFTVVISLYPAIHVVRTRPAEALHRSL